MPAPWRTCSARSSSWAARGSRSSRPWACRRSPISWRATTGHEPPDTDDTDAGDIVEVIVFAAVSGAVIGLTRQLFMRGAKKVYGNPVDKATA